MQNSAVVATAIYLQVNARLLRRNPAVGQTGLSYADRNGKMRTRNDSTRAGSGVGVLVRACKSGQALICAAAAAAALALTTGGVRFGAPSIAR